MAVSFLVVQLSKSAGKVALFALIGNGRCCGCASSRHVQHALKIMFFCYLLHQQINVLLWRRQGRLCVHCALHKLALNVQVLKLLLKLVHGVGHLGWDKRKSVNKGSCREEKKAEGSSKAK